MQSTSRSTARSVLGLILFALLCPVVGIGQTTPRAKKVLTPEQIAYQQAWRDWLGKYESLRQTAQQALATEQAREKAGDCPNADTTRASEECLSREMATTQANYLTVTGALRAMLALAAPEMPGQPPEVGPTGTPPTAAERVAAFDKLEAASAAYRVLGASVAFDEFKGGTLAPLFSQEAEQKLLRSHLDELPFLYDTEFSNR